MAPVFSGAGPAAQPPDMKVAGLTALLALCVALAAGRQDSSVLKDFDFVKVESSGRRL